jgi:hypothetical protein
MLDLCYRFFEYLNLQKIRYCHWKSNGHLNEALNGKTDLDILVHRDDKEKFAKAIEAFPIKRIITPRMKRFPCLEDYLGFDEKTGCLIHLHVHYKLVLGQKFIKNHHLPIEEIIFHHLTKPNTLFLPCPEAELLILTIRAHMKVGVVDLVKQLINDLINRPATPFPRQIEEEFDNLISHSDFRKMVNILLQFKLPLPEKLFTNFITDFTKRKLRFSTIVKNIRMIFSSLQGFKRQNSMIVYVKYFYRYFSSLPLIRKFFKESLFTVTGTGKTFSVVGADGSGKSTLIEDLEKWLSWRLSVVTYYHGIPKTVLKNFIPFIIRQLNKLRLGVISLLIEGLYMIYLAKRRYEISLLSKKDNLAGKIVLTDRFPLKEFNKMLEPMDGPQLFKNTSIVNSFFSKIELNYYDKVMYPDRIFILQADINELRKRKKDLPFDYHKMKADAVNTVEADTHNFLVDANRPYSDVLLDLKKNIWKLIPSDATTLK